MSVIVTPDFELIVGDYLREHPDVSALTSRIGGRTPSSVATPWVRITVLDDRKVTDAALLHLVAGYMQIDCYAGAARDGQQAEASLLGRTVRAALNDLSGPQDEGVVTCVEGLAISRQPDTTFEVARERFIVTCTVYAHP